MPETRSSETISTKLQRIANLARVDSTRVLTALAHHIDEGLLKEAWRRTRKTGAVGIDGQTAEDYAANLDRNLGVLLNRLKDGTYHAPAVRRVHIPKGNGKTRPIGIPTLEDKVLQRAVAMVLEAVYEQDFLDCSYGFRPGRSARDACRALRDGLMGMRGGWVLDVDIQGFFDSLDHGHLRSFLDQRVRDGVLRRAIDKWLKAGVLEDGQVSYPEFGTPQGGVISPLLANIYLHVVLDRWFEEEVRPRLRGRAFLVRYADDFVVVCEREEDAHRTFAVLPKRLGRFGLTLHPEKTRLVRFDRPPRETGKGRKKAHDRGTFDFLGFTHYWARTRWHTWAVFQKTAKDRFNRAIKAIAAWCREHRHLRIVDQHAQLSTKLVGHYQYYGVPGNSRALNRLRWLTGRVWQKWLNRRSQRGKMRWARFNILLKRYPLPWPGIAQRTS